MGEEKKKSFFQAFKDGFKPASARADDMVSESRKQFGNQYEEDRKKGAQFMREKFKKGFFGN